MSAVAALRRKRLRKTKAQLIDELEQTEDRLAGNKAAAFEEINVAGEFKRQEIFFETVFRDVSDAIVFTDPKRRIIMCNPALTRMFGYDKSEVLGRKTDVLYADPKEFQKQGRVRFNPKAESRTKPYLVVYKRKNGQEFQGETVGRPIRDELQNTLGYLGIIRDISELDAVEKKDARFGRAIENLAEGLAFYNSDDRLISCNEEYRRLHPLIGDLLKPGVRFKDLVRAHAERGAIPEAKGRVETYVRERMKQFRNPKGPIIRELVDDTWFIIKEGRTPDGGTYVTTTDITPLKKVETQLRRSQEQFVGAVGALQEGFAIYDSDDRLVTCNDEYLRLHPKMDDILKPGMLFEDLVRTNIERGVNADAIGHEEKHIHERMEHHRNPKGQILRTLTDGKSFIIKESRTPDGGVVVTETDVTERVRAEEDSRRLAAAIEGLSENFALYGPDDRLIVCNEGYRWLNRRIAKATTPGTSFEEHLWAMIEKGLVPEAAGREEEWIEERLERHRNPRGPFELLRQDGIRLLIRDQRMADGSTATISTDITELKRTERLERARNQILEQVAAGGPLADTLSHLVAVAEEMNPMMLASVLILDDDSQRLYLGAAPSLPRFYNEAVDGLRIGPKEGSCGAAAFSGERVIVEDITTHPNWKKFKNTAVKAGLRACWSQPIKSAAGKVLGTFAMYYREPHAPADADLVAIEGIARLAALAIERENMVNDLRTSEERLRGAIESMQEGFALFDRNDRLVSLNDKYRDVNPAAQRILEQGGTFEDLIRANIERGALVEAIGREEAFIKDRLKKHRNPQDPIIRRISDGHWYMLQEVKTPEGGTALSFIDITNLKEAEKALIKSEERLRGAIDSMQEGFVLFDAEDRLVMVNDVYRQINPAADEYLERGMCYQDLMRANVESGRIVEALGREKAFLRERMELHRDPKGPIIRQFSDGTCFILEETSTPEGGIALTFTNITELKDAEKALRESEERFRDVAESAGDWIWEMGADLRFAFLSPRFYDLFPVEPEKIIGKTRDEFAGVGDGDEGWRRHLKDIADHKPFRDFEYAVTTPSGHTRYIRISGKPIFDSNGAFQGYRGTGADVTVAVESEAAAAKAQALLFDAVESITAGFALFNSDDRLVLCNTRYRNLNPALAEAAVPGISFQELIEGVAKAGIYHDSMGPLETFLEKRMDYHRNTPSSHEQRYSDGRWLEINEYSTHEGGTVLIWTDITERRQAEQALRESEDLLNSIFENVPVGLLIKDPDHIVERANDTYLSWYGFDNETMVNRRSDEIEDFQSAQEAEFMNSQERDVLTTGQIQARQVDRIFTDGKTHSVDITKFPVYDQQGNITKVGSVSVDLTEKVQARKALAQSELRFRDFAESSSDWLWEMDEHLCFTYFSERTLQITGFDPTNYLGKTRSEITPENKNDEKWRQHYSDLENHRPFRDFRYDLSRTDGSLLSISINGNPVFDEDGNFSGYRGTGTDITERKLMERHLAGSQRMEALGKLTGGVAHDFNNLLTIILGNLQLLERRITDQNKLQKYVELASRAAQRGAELTKRLLAFARRQRLDLTVFDLNGLVVEMEALIHGTLGETILLENNLSDELWPVKGDPTQLENALLNLVINAKDAMPEGGRFTIETANVMVDNIVAEKNPDAVPGEYVMIAVGDTGCGMSSDVADHVFEPFFTTKEIGMGTGLGLSLVYGFVKQSDGFVKIYSEPSHGTVVKLYLPRFQEDMEVLDDKRTLQEEPVGGHETILVVEDDPDVRHTTVELLEELGYQVIEAEDGPSALRVLDNHCEIHLLFTDVVMPGGLKGPELALEIRIRRPGMKVLYMSGYTEYGAFQDNKVEIEGMLLSKPFEKSELADKLRLTLDS